MNTLQLELLTALWDGPRTGEELLSVFRAVVGDREISFKEAMDELCALGWVQITGRDATFDEIYAATEPGVDECGKYLYGAEVGKGGKHRRKAVSTLAAPQTLTRDGASVGQSMPRTNSAENWFWGILIFVVSPVCAVYVIHWWVKVLAAAN